MYIVTEPVTPLETYLKNNEQYVKQNELAISWGLHQITVSYYGSLCVPSGVILKRIYLVLHDKVIIHTANNFVIDLAEKIQRVFSC